MPRFVVKSTMAGTVARLEVERDEMVVSEQTLLFLEVMKMEIPVESPAVGRIVTVHVDTGDLVAQGQPLVTLEN